MLGRQTSDERMYLSREKGATGIKCLKDVYKEMRLLLACYMHKSKNRWIQAAWRRELLKEEKFMLNKSTIKMEQVWVKLRFWNNARKFDDELAETIWKPTWKIIKTVLKKSVELKKELVVSVKRTAAQNV